MRLLAALFVLATALPAAAQQAPDAARIYNLPEVDVLPQMRNAADFSRALHHGYPKDLRAAGVSGTVNVGFIVGPNGRPRDIEVLSTSDERFNNAAVRAVRLLRFTPAEVDGRRVAVRIEQPIAFQIRAAAHPAAGPLHARRGGEQGIAVPSRWAVPAARVRPVRAI